MGTQLRRGQMDSKRQEEWVEIGSCRDEMSVSRGTGPSEAAQGVAIFPAQCCIQLPLEALPLPLPPRAELEAEAEAEPPWAAADADAWLVAEAAPAAPAEAVAAAPAEEVPAPPKAQRPQVARQ